MIYLDHHAATPLAEPVRAAMREAAEQAWANPSSVHRAGRAARQMLEAARRDIAQAIDAQPADLVLTAGASEGCNLALRGLARSVRRIITTSIEHPAMAACCAQLEREGYVVERLPIPDGLPPAPSMLDTALGVGPALVAMQWVNHETGNVFPIDAYAEVCTRHGAPLVVDASQALGKLPCSVRTLGATAVVFSAAKVGGPAGAATVWFERCRDVSPVILGGSQERGRRAGTPDVVAQAGFAAAARAIGERLAALPRITALRDRLEAALVELGGRVNGAGGPRVGTVSNASFAHWRGDMLVPALDLEGLCASSGAACSSGVGEPSPVLLAMYPDEPARAASALRLSLGPETSEDDVAGALAILRRVLPRGLRA